MGYQIRYGETRVKEKIKLPFRGKSRKRFIGVLIGSVICIILGLVARNERVQDILIPGDADVTRAAFGCFVDEVQSGSTMIEAATVFCKEILEGAKVS